MLQLEAKSQWVKDYGCAMMCVLEECNKRHLLTVSSENVDLYHRILAENDCFTKDQDIIWVRAFSTLGLKVTYLGHIEEGADFIFYNWYNARTGWYHFTHGKKNVCTYDPLGYSITAKEGIIYSVRGFKV